MATGLRDLLEPVRGRLTAAAVLAGIASLCALVPLIAVTMIIREILESGYLSAAAWFWVASAIAGAVARVVLNLVATSLSHYADADFRAGIRSRIVEHLALLPLGWFGMRGSGAVKKAVGDDVRRMHVVVAHLAADLTSAVVTPVAATVLLGLIDWRLMLALLAYLVITGLFTLPAAARSMSTYYDDYDAAVAATTTATVELVDGIDVVKSFGGDSREASRFHRAVDAWVEICLLWTRAGSRPASLLSILTSPASMTVWVLLSGIGSVALGWSEPWAVVPFLLIGVAVPGSFQQLGAMTNAIRQAIVAGRHVGGILDEQTLPVRARPQNGSGNAVELDRVTFAYPGSDTPALRDVTLALQPGTVTALVGGSGSGKSTIARLIPRFYNVTDGAVRVGGVDVRDMDPAHLLGKVAIVFQDSILVAGTVRDNLLLASPDASDHDLERAVHAARLSDVVQRLPQGLDTEIGSGDADLSGGEKQRLTIARAMLQDAPVLLLDEATAHVDPQGEVEIQRALAALAAGRTVLVIAHRLRTIQDADRIVVLRDGGVVEQGSHDDLVAADGTYAELLRAQRAGEPEMKGAGR